MDYYLTLPMLQFLEHRKMGSKKHHFWWQMALWQEGTITQGLFFKNIQGFHKFFQGPMSFYFDIQIILFLHPYIYWFLSSIANVFKPASFSFLITSHVIPVFLQKNFPHLCKALHCLQDLQCHVATGKILGTEEEEDPV